MSATPRIVLPELLDELAPGDPRARRSRRDLRRVHRAMGSVWILKQAILQLRLAAPPQRILELGAGDGTLMLRLAQSMRPRWRKVALTILDRHDLVTTETRAGYESLGWDLTVLRTDVLDWVAEDNRTHFDLCTTCLFLHHFDSGALARLLLAIASRADAFVACEPRRSLTARTGSRLIGLLGSNTVTRKDAVTSVAAGFSNDELTATWPSLDAGWTCNEYPAWLFTHCFTAVRNSVRSV